MSKLMIIGIKDAAQILRDHGFHISEGDLRAGIEQRIYPFGDAIVVTKKPVFHIYRPLLMNWINERSE